MSKAATATSSQLDQEIQSVSFHAAQAPAITVNPERLGGAAVIGLSRVPVTALLDYLACGDTLDDFLKDFPSVDREKAIGVLDAIKDAVEDGLLGVRIDY
ncbi:MAG: DUF433 domain-containing protein [Blastocatellia bacterium]